MGETFAGVSILPKGVEKTGAKQTARPDWNTAQEAEGRGSAVFAPFLGLVALCQAQNAIGLPMLFGQSICKAHALPRP